MSSNAVTLLTVHGLERTSSGERLLDSVSFSIQARDRIVCQGPSGAGKTILLRCLARLDACQGRWEWLGDPVPENQIPRYRSHVMYLPQRPQFPVGTVRDALDEPFHWRVHHGKQLDEARAVALLQKLGFSESMLQNATDKLSEGESQVVSLVRAILLEPQILLLDEPTSAVDAARSRDVENLVCHWLDDPIPRAVLWVTHDAMQAERLATRRFLVHAGKVSVDA